MAVILPKGWYSPKVESWDAFVVPSRVVGLTGERGLTLHLATDYTWDVAFTTESSSTDAPQTLSAADVNAKSKRVFVAQTDYNDSLALLELGRDVYLTFEIAGDIEDGPLAVPVDVSGWWLSTAPYPQ